MILPRSAAVAEQAARLEPALGPWMELGLSAHFGRPTRIAALRSTTMHAQSTHPIDRLELTLDPGQSLTAVLKRLIPLDDHRPKGGAREVLVYQRLLARTRFGAPAVYASEYNPAQGRYWLLLEDVGDSTLKHADMREWEAAVVWLANLHGAYMDRVEELRALGCLSEHDTRYYQAIACRARQNLEQAGARQALARFNRLMDHADALISRLAHQPRTLVHGDIFSRNLMIQPGGRVRPIDWESAAIGLPIWDLARLLSGWEAEKPAFLATYLAALERATPVPIDRHAFADMFAQCEILDVAWYFGWSPGPCTDEARVASLLDALEVLWQGLDLGDD